MQAYIYAFDKYKCIHVYNTCRYRNFCNKCIHCYFHNTCRYSYFYNMNKYNNHIHNLHINFSLIHKNTITPIVNRVSYNNLRSEAMNSY